jgi:CRP-like cAMP-binding protein
MAALAEVTAERDDRADFVCWRLNSLTPLDAADFALVRSTSAKLRNLPAGVTLPWQKRPYCSLVVNGWVGRLRLFSDGRRQILTTVLPGELTGGHPNALIAAMAVTLTDTRIADLALLYDALDAAPSSHGQLRNALKRATELEEAQLAEQVVRLGRRTAFERVGHWLLEVQERLAAANMGRGERFPMPLTQELLSDVLGLSVVHVNRIVQQLRRDRLVEIKNGYVTILEPERLCLITEFISAKERKRNSRGESPVSRRGPRALS